MNRLTTPSRSPFSARSIRFQLWYLFGILFFIGGCNLSVAEEPQSYRIGLLSGTDPLGQALDGFRDGMAELGYIEGEMVQYDFQRANGDREKMKTIAEQFVIADVDLIVTTTTGAAQDAREVTNRTTNTPIPVVFTVVSDPVGSDLVNDLRYPGGNITGVTRSLGGIIRKRVVFLQEIMPDLNGLWLPYMQGYATATLTRTGVHEIADPAGIAVIETSFDSVEMLLAEIDRFSQLEELPFEVLFISPDPITHSDEGLTALLNFAEAHQIPVVANAPSQVRDGALFTYSDDTYQTGYLAATLADKILQGTDPGGIPIAFSEPKLYINYKTAQLLDLAIPESLLAQADEIIR